MEVQFKCENGIPENRDLGPWWDPSGTLGKPKNRDLSGTLAGPRKTEKAGP